MNSKSQQIVVKRIYEPVSPEDGCRLLVDRLWPRGISREKAALDDWMKNIAPSPELRQSFAHMPERYDTFSELYRSELAADPVRRSLSGRILEIADRQRVTLLYAAKDPVYNHANVLRQWLLEQ